MLGFFGESAVSKMKGRVSGALFYEATLRSSIAM